MADENQGLNFEEFFGGAQYLQQLANWLAKDADGYEKVIEAAKAFAVQLDADVKAGKKLKYVSEAVEILVRAFKELVIARSDVGEQAAIFSTIAARETKITKAHAKSIASLKDSYYGWQAALEEAEMQLKMLSTTSDDYKEKSTKLLGVIKDMRTNIREFNLMTGNVGLVTTEDKLKAQIANLQQEGQVMADLRQQITAFKAAQKGLAEGKFFSVEGIAQAEELRRKFEALDKGAEDYDTQLKELINSTLKLVAVEKQLGKSYKLQDVAEGATPEAGVHVTRDDRGALKNVEVAKMELLTYEQLNAVYKLITETLHNYNTEQLQTDETAKKLVATQEGAVAMLNKFDTATGKVSRRWDGLRMQVTQVIRELPSMAISANTFFLAISNNIPYLADEIGNARKEFKEFRKDVENYAKSAGVSLKAAEKHFEDMGRTVESAGKRVVNALKSWNTWLVVIMTVLSFFGKDIINWVKNVFVAEKAVTDLNKAMENINKQAVKNNADYAKQATLLKSLSSIWQQLTTNEQRVKFVEEYKDKFKELGVSIKDVNDAENLFMKHTDDMLKALKLRAQQAAAQAKIEEEYKKVIEHEFNIEDYRGRIEEQLKLRERYQEKIKELSDQLSRTTDSAQRAAIQGQIDGLYSGIVEIDQVVERLTKRIEKQTKDIAANAKSIETYQKAYERLLKGERDLLDEAGIDPAKAAQKQKDLLNRLNQEQLNALKRRNKMEEAIMADGYAKNVKKIKDGYDEERKEIQKQMDSIKSLLKKEWGVILGVTSAEALDRLDPVAKGLIQLLGELNDQYKLVDKAENADLGKEWLAEQTRRAQAAKDAVQLQLDAVRAGSEEEYRLKMELIWKEYDAEIAANKEKEQTKQQDSLAIYEKYLKKETDLRNAHDKEMRERRIQQLELETKGMAYGREASTKTEQRIELQREQALADIEQSGLGSEEQEEKRLATEQYYDRLILQERIKLANQLVSVEKNQVGIETDLAKKSSEEKLRLLIEQNYLAEQTELNNAYLSAATPEEYDRMVKLITAKYRQLANFIKGDFAVEVLDDQQALAEAVFNIVEQTEQDITRFELEQERDRLNKQIQLAEKGMLDWSEAQIEAAKATVEGINNQLKRLEGIGAILDRIADHGLLGLFDMTDAQYDAWENYADFIGDQIDKIIDKYIELAQAAVDAQQQQVDAAQTVYEAELEARANGYANNVETAKKELQLQKQTLKEKQKRLEEAERYQRIADEASTASSLITAIAQLYKAYAGVPYVGLIIAAAAVTGLLGMFAAGKASAKAAASQNYGGGGLEILQGGSHASGNDIDLGVNNRHGRRMRAEGGESMAIFSKRATRRYSEVLPDLVASINKGNFEEQYAQSFELPDEMRLGIGKERYVNLSKIEGSLDQLTAQGAERYSVMPDGTVVVRIGNVTKIIKK